MIETSQPQLDHFITAGFGRYKGSGKRLFKQAQESDWFENIYLYDDKILKTDPVFMQHHASIMAEIPSGFFIWKPYIILSVLMQAKDGELILYCDSGCELNPLASKTMNEWIELTSQNDMTVFTSGCHWQPFAKSVTQEFFLNQEIKNEFPISVAATYLLIKNSPAMREFIRKWYGLCMKDDYRLLNDNSYGKKEQNDFIAHRHDQTILHFLLMGTSLKIKFLEDNLWRTDWRDAKELPILALRNRHKYSVLKAALNENVSTLPLTKKILSRVITFF